MRANGLHTVCEEAGCPNIGECWDKKHATFMIMGEICTRACAFCNVSTGRPLALDREEPANVAAAVKKMGLSHVVITSVDRDDLDDGGAQHFEEVIRAIRDYFQRSRILLCVSCAFWLTGFIVAFLLGPILWRIEP